MLRRDLRETIGRTPLLLLRAISRGTGARIAGKLEGCNPGGSIKDRIALAMIEDAERRGTLKPGGRIVEPSSGNTGIGLAMLGSARGYRVTVTMPESMSVDRRRLIEGYGAEVLLTPAAGGMAGSIERAHELAGCDGAFMPMQFENPVNPVTHRLTTGPEIWAETGGEVDIVVCGVGTGGTITGVGEFLKSRNPRIAMVAVEPAESAVLGGGEPGPHPIEGIGAGFVPRVLNREVIDEVVAVTGGRARETARRLAREEGIFAGISSGAALAAAVDVAARPENGGKLLVAVLPDRGDRYFGSGLWD